MTSRTETYRDFPFDAICKEAKELIEAQPNIRLHQKFTCAGCGNRLTMDKPNIFFETGTCDNCPAVTDIRKQGCNYLAHIVFGINDDETEAFSTVEEAKEFLRKRSEGGKSDAKQSEHQNRDRD